MRDNKTLYTIISIGLILAFWQVLTLFVSPIIVPSIPSVIEALIDILTTHNLLNMIVITFVRLVIGLSIGIVLGCILGILMGHYQSIYYLLNPIISLFQTLPPVIWVVLALVWFGFNSLPAIFIITLTSLPIITYSIVEAVHNIDSKLIEMSQIYQFSKEKRLKNIVIPSILPFFKSGLKLVIGTGWKIAVMAEVLTTTDGIGGMIRSARLNVQTQYVIAWAIIIVLLYHLSELIINQLLFRKKGSHVKGK